MSKDGLPRSETIISLYDEWSENWNRDGADSTRRRVLNFLSSWRDRSGDWFEKVADDFFEYARLFPEFGVAFSEANLRGTLKRLHFCNHTIWHFEAEARRDDVDPEKIVEVKRGIDAGNQKRNDQMERIDDIIIDSIQPDSTETTPVQSEPPGLMLDRLSILSLKIFHYSHKDRSGEVGRLEEQRRDLGKAFDRMVEAVSRGKRRIKVYKQLKTYNDPELNPAMKNTETQGESDAG
ncbi:MAG: DUF4254 domain-containing protein [bacterium]